MEICNGSIRNQFLLSVLHNNFHLLEHFTNPSVELQWLLLHSAPDKLHYLNAIDPIVATSAEMLFLALSGIRNLQVKISATFPLR